MVRVWGRFVGCAVLLAVAGAALAADVSVPHLVGLPEEGAMALLNRRGLQLGICQYGCSANQRIGNVYRQKPAADTLVASGTAVDVVVAMVPSPAKSNPVWPWGSNPASHTNVMSFCDAQQALMDNLTLTTLLPEEYGGFLALLAPGTGDLNGTSFVVLKDPYPDGDVRFELNGDGRNDCQIQLRLIGDVLADPTFAIAAHDSYTGLTYAKVLRALNVNYEQFEQDVGSFWPWLGSMSNGLHQVLIGHMIVGNGDASFTDPHDEGTPPVPTPNRIDCSGSAGFVKAAMFLLGGTGYIANPQIDFSAYIRMPEFFAMGGDADGDGASNVCEYDYAHDPEAFPGLTVDQRADQYAVFALDPHSGPPSCYCLGACISVARQSHDRWYETGDRMELSVGFIGVGVSTTYVWDRDGVPIGGAATNTYVKAAVALEDSGVYRCTATNPTGPAARKDVSEVSASATMAIRVVPEGTLPAAAPVALGALIGVLVGCGGFAVGRKHR